MKLEVFLLRLQKELKNKIIKIVRVFKKYNIK
jgi:hypothetical protein